MWKAFLVLIMLGGDIPFPRIAIGEFQQVFVSEADCRQFIQEKEADAEFHKTLKSDTDVVGHELDCRQDGSGQES